MDKVLSNSIFTSIILPIIIASVEDRLTVAAILIKNDYTVRQGKQLRQGKKSYEYYLEYTPNDKPKQAAGE